MPKRAREETASSSADAAAEEETREITKEGEMPRKCFYRSRAHCNPLSHNDAFDYPVAPPDFDWSVIYPKLNRAPDFVDVGCGFGGLTCPLAVLPGELAPRPF